MADYQDYLLHLADNALILGQRNAEWCGHGPNLEEDLAMGNNSLDQKQRRSPCLLSGRARFQELHTLGAATPNSQFAYVLG